METLIIYLSAILVSFGLTALSGKFLIPRLKKLNFGQTIREDGPTWHMGKQGTPTIGGVMFMLGTVVSTVVVLVLLGVMNRGETQLVTTKLVAGLLMALGFGLIGFIDDYTSVKKKQNKGLSEKQKLLLQFLVAAAYLFSVALAGGKTEYIIPLIGTFDLGFFYYIISAVIIVGIANATNFADGVDGLCSMVCFFPMVAFALMAQLRISTGISAVGMACAAALLGFLLWNFHPAKVFMGDTGSQFLGGMICALAFGVDMQALLLLAAIVPLLELGSVVLQVTYFKATKGKRIFKMSPIHHHYEMKGWSEEKICVVFSSVSLLGSAAALVLFVAYFGW